MLIEVTDRVQGTLVPPLHWFCDMACHVARKSLMYTLYGGTRISYKNTLLISLSFCGQSDCIVLAQKSVIGQKQRSNC